MSTFRRSLNRIAVCLMWPALSVAQPAESDAQATATDDIARCEVWARELGFARSVAEHDARAFAQHVHQDAVFGPGTPRPAKGRDAVVGQWAELIEGKRVRLSWYPARVVVAGTGDHAWSTGPALYEDLSPAPKHRYRLGQFNSVWQRDPDGVWRVLFDDGIQPRPATDAEADAFQTARRQECPAD